MAKCHQNTLNIFALIYKATGTGFLSKYLHPEYSLYDYRFENFDLSDLSKMVIIKNELDSKNKRSNDAITKRMKKNEELSVNRGI